MVDAVQDTAKDADDLVALRGRAVLLVGFAGAFRRSELANLMRKDIDIDDEGMVIHLRHSKTDQTGFGDEKAIERAATGHCPVAALEQWLARCDRRAAARSAAIFRAVDQWGNVCDSALSDLSVAMIIQRAAGLAGLPPGEFPGHSLRAGFVTDQLANGAGEIKVIYMTGHKSVNTLRKYYRPERGRKAKPPPTHHK